MLAPSNTTPSVSLPPDLWLAIKVPSAGPQLGDILGSRVADPNVRTIEGDGAWVAFTAKLAQQSSVAGPQLGQDPFAKERATPNIGAIEDEELGNNTDTEDALEATIGGLKLGYGPTIFICRPHARAVKNYTRRSIATDWESA